jgi:hypothetical protein
MRQIEIQVGDVVATATLRTDAAPNVTAKLWAALPLDVPLSHAIRSGNCAEASAADLVEPDQKVESQVSFFYPGMVAYRPLTGELTFAYGQGQARSETGTHWVSFVGQIDGDGKDIFAAWERTRSVGASSVAIRRKEDA